jgi:predicted acetyltransferase
MPPDNLASGEIRLQFDSIVPGDPARGFVPYYHFHILERTKGEIGHINFRVGNTGHVLVCAGHIGYQIEEQFRGQGYALQACRAITPWVRSFYKSVTITSDPDNPASISTIEKLGAVFVDEVAVPKDDPHYLRGSRTKRRYRWEP